MLVEIDPDINARTHATVVGVSGEVVYLIVELLFNALVTVAQIELKLPYIDSSSFRRDLKLE